MAGGASFCATAETAKENVRSILAYVFTEMVNNAVDHSGGNEVRVTVWVFDPRFVFELVDDGEGVFHHIQQGYDCTMPSPRSKSFPRGRHDGSARLEQFSEVVLDFSGVREVGQSFVDQLFRVWAREHAETKLIPVNMSPAVEAMIRRGISMSS